jgi:hypothetical protein
VKLPAKRLASSMYSTVHGLKSELAVENVIMVSGSLTRDGQGDAEMARSTTCSRNSRMVHIHSP